MGAGGCFQISVIIAPMKLRTVASKARTSSQKPETENRDPIAAVAPIVAAAPTVSVAASMWKSGNGE